MKRRQTRTKGRCWCRCFFRVVRLKYCFISPPWLVRRKDMSYNLSRQSKAAIDNRVNTLFASNSSNRFYARKILKIQTVFLIISCNVRNSTERNRKIKQISPADLHKWLFDLIPSRLFHTITICPLSE